LACIGAIRPYFTGKAIVRTIRGDQLYRTLTGLLQPLNYLIPVQNTSEEKRKRLLVVGSVLLAIPFLAMYTIQGLGSRNWLNLAMNGGTLVIYATSFGILLRISDGIRIYRLLTLVLTTLFIYNIVNGPNGQLSIMWMLTFPPVIFFIFGLPEGLFWFGLIVTSVITVLGFPHVFGTYHYHPETVFQFTVLFILFTGLSIGAELLRWYFHDTLEQQRTELGKALENVRTLGGLLPICSVCKKIRDDRGYWNQLETYLSSHSDAKFSHGMCDDCFQEQYPDIYAKRTILNVDKSIPTPTENN
jgi:hypothetical protein